MGRIGTAHKAEEQSRACPTDQNRQHSAEGTSPRHTLRKHPLFAEEDKGQGTFQRDDRLLALHALSVLWQRHCRGADCGGESVRCRSSVSRRGSTKDHVDNDNKLYYVTKDFHAAHHVNYALNFKHGLQALRHQLTQVTLQLLKVLRAGKRANFLEFSRNVCTFVAHFPPRLILFVSPCTLTVICLQFLQAQFSVLGESSLR